MKFSDPIVNYKKSIASYLGIASEEVTLFWKGRVALYAILKSLGVGKNDEVILPAFTCVVVPNAIIYSGARPVYVDIDPDTYNMDIQKLEQKITSRTKIIIAQNTFGLAPDLDSIMQLAARYNIRVIEDCTHGFGGRYKGRLNGTIADASFFSTQWNKPFSTGVGGIAVIKKTSLIEKMQEIENSAIKPSVKDNYTLEFLSVIREKILPKFLYWTALRTYRFLSSKNLIIGSSSGKELEGPSMEPDFLKGASAFQAKKGAAGINTIDAANKHRIGIAETYSIFLKNAGKKYPDVPKYATHTFLKYPIQVKQRDYFLAEAMKHNIEIGEWFLSPIHPIKDNFQIWYYNYGENPIAESIAERIVNLPTHPGISKNELDKILNFLNKYLHLIE
jgi:perosamine synthetase